MEKDCEPTRKTVSLATVMDIDGVLSIQNQNLLENKQGDTEEEKINGGFLIHPLSKEDLTKIINNSDSHILLVAKEGNEIQGYILGYNLDDWKRQRPNWQTLLEISDETKEILKREKILYMRHIARKPDGKGIGSSLLVKMFEEVSARGYLYVIAEILQEPYMNIASVQFAEKFGLTMVGKRQEENGYVWGLFMKKI
jgi:predicted GNAT superfamily acetyltransferase